MTCKLVILRSVQSEYSAILDYLVGILKSPHAAADFVDEFDKQIALIRDAPELYGLSRMPELACKGYRTFFVKNYVVLYKHAENLIVIAHIFHQTQDYAKYI